MIDNADFKSTYPVFFQIFFYYHKSLLLLFLLQWHYYCFDYYYELASVVDQKMIPQNQNTPDERR